MSKKTFNKIEENISIINLLSNEVRGITLIDEKKIETVINKTNEYAIIIGSILNPENSDLFQLKFSNELLSLNIDTFISSRENKINVTENYFQSYSKGTVHRLKSEEFDTKQESKYRAFLMFRNYIFKSCTYAVLIIVLFFLIIEKQFVTSVFLIIPCCCTQFFSIN